MCAEASSCVHGKYCLLCYHVHNVPCLTTELSADVEAPPQTHEETTGEDQESDEEKKCGPTEGMHAWYGNVTSAGLRI